MRLFSEVNLFARAACSASLALAACAGSALAKPSITALPVPAGYLGTYVSGMSDDGSVVVAISAEGTTFTGSGYYNGLETSYIVTAPTPGAASILALGGLIASRRRRIAR